MPTGGERLVSHLIAQGVRHVFTVPGESFIAALDAMHAVTDLQPVTCRNEAGAAMMAEATGKLTGRPGIAFVTRGPGAANAVPGVYIAHQDATPMVLLIGLPATGKQPPTFQEVDIASLFASISKWAAVVPSTDDIEAFVARAFSTTLSGRRGPVVLGLPENILSDLSDVLAARTGTTAAGLVSPAPEKLAHLRLALAHTKNPLIIAGGGDWSAAASQNLQRFAERFDIPVATSFRRQDHFDNRHRCYVGPLGFAPATALQDAVRRSDCVIALGTRLGDVTTQGHSLLKSESSGKRLIRVATDADNPPPLYAQSLGIAASPEAVAETLCNLEPPKNVPWSSWRRELRMAYEASLKTTTERAGLQLDEVILMLSRHLPDDAIICNGAGNYAAFLHRHFQYKLYPSQLAPTSGSMGYGLPAAIAAKLAEPSRTVVAIAGDGCFQMTAQEFATAAQMDLPLIVVIANNGSLGTIRQHQEQRFPGRIVATTLTNPDFVAFAKSHGAQAELVTTNLGFAAALHRALQSNRLTLIELKIDIDAITPGVSLKSLALSALGTQTAGRN